MKKLLLPIVFGSFALPAVAMEQQLVEAWNESLDLPEISAEAFDSYNLSANAQANRRRQNNRWFYKDGPKRTRFFSGIEYTDNTYDLNPRQQNWVRILADGSTKVHNNLRIRYVINQVNAYKGKEGEESLSPRTNVIVAPRYERWVSPNFNWWTELMLRESTSASAGPNGARGSKDVEWKPKVGGNWSFGRNNFNAIAETMYREGKEFNNANWTWTDDTKYSTGYWGEIGYTRRVNNRTNFGIKVFANEIDNEWNNWARSVQVNANYRFSNRIRTEIQIRRGKDGQKANDSGYRFTNYNINTNFPINDTFSGIFNVAYRTGKRYGNMPGWGDRDAMFFKAGVNVAF